MRMILIAALLLAGCGTTPKPAVEVRTVEVVKEVQRPCASTKPDRPESLPQPLPSDARQLVALLTAKLLEWSGPGKYADRAEAAIDECTKAERPRS